MSVILSASKFKMYMYSTLVMIVWQAQFGYVETIYWINFNVKGMCVGHLGGRKRKEEDYKLDIQVVP